MSAVVRESRTIDWSKPVRTRHEIPLIGYLLPDLGVEGKRRVGLPSMSLKHEPEKTPTIYRYGDDGISRCDGQPSDYDLVNFDPRDGGEGLALHPDALKGMGR